MPLNICLNGFLCVVTRVSTALVGVTHFPPQNPCTKSTKYPTYQMHSSKIKIVYQDCNHCLTPIRVEYQVECMHQLIRSFVLLR
jgi:hypothetical protein